MATDRNSTAAVSGCQIFHRRLPYVQKPMHAAERQDETGQMSENTMNVEETKTEWLSRLESLVSQIEQWAQELDWSTRRIEKKIEDSLIGRYEAPALLLQQEFVRILLEPITHSAPGASGVADLYLMPAYDDIASLYYFDNVWHLHYVFRSEPVIARIREAESRPLSKENFRAVLDEMKAHAASLA